MSRSAKRFLPRNRIRARVADRARPGQGFPPGSRPAELFFYFGGWRRAAPSEPKQSRPRERHEVEAQRKRGRARRIGGKPERHEQRLLPRTKILAQPFPHQPKD